MTLNLIIRQAIAADAHAVEVLYRQLVNNHAVSVLSDRITQVNQDPNTALLVCEYEGIVIGTALVSLCADVMFQAQPFAVIENIVIESSFRNSGIGSALMKEIEDFCYRADCSKIMLLSSSDRIQAHMFFEHVGFIGSSKRGFVKYRSQFNIAE